MERAGAMTGKIRELNGEQKEKIAELRSITGAKIAEARIFLDEKIKQSGDRPEFAETVAEAKRAFQDDKERLERKLEEEIARVKEGR